MKAAIGSALVVLAWLAVIAPLPAAVGEQGYIGIQIKKNDNGDGILVVAAVAASPADMAGIRGTDVIVKLNGKKVEGELTDDQHAKVTSLLVELSAYNVMRLLHELQTARTKLAFDNA